MLDEGEYSIWFKTPLGQGTGLITLSGGRVTGQDAFFAYSGSYEQVDDRFYASVRITRYLKGDSSIFGVDDVELKLAGTTRGATASCTGAAVQAPGVEFEATLIRSSNAPTIRQELRAAPKFNPNALPKPKMR